MLFSGHVEIKKTDERVEIRKRLQIREQKKGLLSAKNHKDTPLYTGLTIPRVGTNENFFKYFIDQSLLVF